MTPPTAFIAGVAIWPAVYIARIAWSWIQYWRTPRWRR